MCVCVCMNKPLESVCGLLDMIDLGHRVLCFAVEKLVKWVEDHEQEQDTLSASALILESMSPVEIQGNT